MADVGPRPPDSDVPRPRDAGPPTAMCPQVRADATCLESFLVAPGRPFSLPYVFDQCACCAETECVVEVDEAARRLHLTTTLCPDPCDCDECIAPSGLCEVPALPAGDWRVSVNGAPAFELPVHEDSGLVPPPPACARYSEVDRCEPTGAGGARPWAVTETCAEQDPFGPLDVVRVYNPCSSCHVLDGPCIAELTPRLTDDLPPGGDIHLAPFEYGTACDVDCPEVCLLHPRECIVPALTRGDFYRVLLEGRVIGTFTAGVPGEMCAFATTFD